MEMNLKELIKVNSKKGSLTVESCIVLPIFICLIVSIAFFTKVVYTHHVVQHAITETAEGIAFGGYIYHISGFDSFNGNVNSDMESRSGIFKKYLPEIFDSYNILYSYANIDEDNSYNYVKELENAAGDIVNNNLANIKNQLFIPIVKNRMKVYLSGGSIEDLDTCVKRMNIVDGFEGLDFSRSNFFKHGSSQVDIVVTYRINLPVPFKVYPELLIAQRASVNAWGGGDECLQEEDIWSLRNMQRGKRVRELFGANLPWFFPGISGFYSGKAVLIRSMDLTANSYKSGQAVEEKVLEYINDLSSYKGQPIPWGKQEIVIREEEIKARELILVIPRNPVSPSVKKVIYDCVNKAASQGIVLTIKEYGYKRLEETE